MDVIGESTVVVVSRNATREMHIPAICGFHRTCKEALRSFCIFCFPWHLFSLRHYGSLMQDSSHDESFGCRI